MLVYRRISPCFMMYPYYITIFTILYNSHDIPIYQASWAKLHEGAGSKSNSTKAGDLLGDPSRFQETTWIYIRFTYCSWFMVDLWLIYGWFMVDLWLIYGWFVVDLWLIYGWFMVDLGVKLELLRVQFHGYFVENTMMSSQLFFCDGLVHWASALATEVMAYHWELFSFCINLKEI